MRRRDLFAATLAILAAAPAMAADGVAIKGVLAQGGLVEGRAPPGTRVTIDGRPARVAPQGIFLVGAGREAKTVALEIVYPDGRREAQQLAVQQRQFAVQRIDGLPDKMVTPPPAVQARIKAEGEQVRAVRRRDDARLDFHVAFAWPVTGRISGVYGSQRILNGEPRAPHYGVDIAGPVGTPIKAPAPGIVTLAADLYFTGWTVILDHGHGLSSVLMHLDSVVAKEGQALKQGEVLGTLGATGRATGPHLHWGLNLFETRLDPQLLVPPMPE